MRSDALAGLWLVGRGTQRRSERGNVPLVYSWSTYAGQLTSQHNALDDPTQLVMHDWVISSNMVMKKLGGVGCPRSTTRAPLDRPLPRAPLCARPFVRRASVLSFSHVRPNCKHAAWQRYYALGGKDIWVAGAHHGNAVPSYGGLTGDGVHLIEADEYATDPSSAPETDASTYTAGHKR